MQYRALLQRMEGGGTWYQEQQNPFGGMPMAEDGLCMKLCLCKHGLQSLLSRKNLLLLTAGAGKNTAPFCKKKC